MTTREPKEAWLVAAAEAEANSFVSVGGLAVRIARLEQQERLTERTALGKLIELRRRDLGLSIDDVALRAHVAAAEVASLEQGVIGQTTHHLIQALALPLGLPADKLLHLAGLNGDTDPAIQDAAVRFAAQASPVEKLSPGEHAALSSFLHALTAGT